MFVAGSVKAKGEGSVTGDVIVWEWRVCWGQIKVTKDVFVGGESAV